MPFSVLTSPVAEKIVVTFLAVEFIGFGITHFTHLHLAAAQVPPWIPYATVVAVVTGVLEIGIGLLVIPTNTRRGAAMAYLMLLILFIPAVHNMLANDAALPFGDAWRTVWRIAVIPNNLLLAAGAVYLIWKSPQGVPRTGSGEPPQLSPARSCGSRRCGGSGKSDEPFDPEVFNVTGVLDRQVLEQRMELFL